MVRVASLALLVIWVNPTLASYPITEEKMQNGPPCSMTVKEILWLQGQYDLLVISESSDEVTAAAFSLNILKQGNLRGQTLRAITAAEMEKILEKVG
jgi:uncharacterized protein with GYD domain